MMVDLRHGEPIRFGEDGHAGVVMGSDGRLRIVEVAEVGVDALLVHDAHREDPSLAFALARLSTDDPRYCSADWAPTPFGVFRDIDRSDYGTMVGAQLAEAATKKGPGDLRALLQSAGTWNVT
jgi:2-oxoglutarate ferredoxin oxidoreductase subunit beta